MNSVAGREFRRGRPPSGVLLAAKRWRQVRHFNCAESSGIGRLRLPRGRCLPFTASFFAASACRLPAPPVVRQLSSRSNFTKLWAAGDGRRFDRIVAAARHQRRIELKEFLLESSVRAPSWRGNPASSCRPTVAPQAYFRSSEETASTKFDERLVEWMLPEPARTSILGLLRIADQIVLPDGTPTGVDGFTALGWWATKAWCPPSRGIRRRAVF